MSVTLLDNRVLISPQQEETSNGGIVLPGSAQEKSDTGLVKATGPGKTKEDGGKIAMTVKDGDKVLYSKYSGTEVKIAGEDYIIIREEDIMGVLA
jgi:chaperonin GroES